MSVKSKARRAKARAQQKRAQKAAMKAKYAAFRDAGITKNSKRQQQKAQVKKLRTKRTRTRIPFPYHLYLKADGTLRPGSPHKAFLAMQEAA